MFELWNQTNVPAPTNFSPTYFGGGHQDHDDSSIANLSRSIAEVMAESLELTRDIDEQNVVSNLTDHSYQEEAVQARSIVETTSPGLSIARNSDEPAIVLDLIDHTYHEEYDEDEASIHHGSDTISVADYQSEHLLNDTSQSPCSSSARNGNLPVDRVLPAHLNDQLERWASRHGRSGPKCIYRRSEASMSELWYRQKSSAPVTWLHRSGVSLNVTWYHLPGTPVIEEKHGPKLIVVSGPGVAPSIVAYKNAGGFIAGVKETGVVYRIWQGLDGDRDGFEISPSVIKISKGARNTRVTSAMGRLEAQKLSKSYGSEVPEQSHRCEKCVTQHRSCDGKKPTCGRCASFGKTCKYRGESVSRSGQDAPKREIFGDPTVFQRSERARRPVARYASEEFAPARKRKVEDTSFDQDDDEESEALLSKFMTSRPLANTSSPTSARASKSKPWACYLCDHARTHKKDMRYHLRQIHGIAVPDEARMRATDFVQEIGKAQHTSKIQTGMELRGAEKAREIDRVRGMRQQVQDQDQDWKLEEYINNNAKVMFFSPAQARRVRSFSACNSVHKLFAQATAGGVFSKEQARVLAVEVEDQEDELPIVEDDEEDFDHFVMQLRNAACWSVRNGQVEGDTVIYVREKRK